MNHMWRRAARTTVAAVAALLIYLRFAAHGLWALAPLGMAGLLMVLGHGGARSGLVYGVGDAAAAVVDREFVGPIGSVPLAALQAPLVGVSTAATAVVSRTTGRTTVWRLPVGGGGVSPLRGSLPWLPLGQAGVQAGRRCLPAAGCARRHPTGVRSILRPSPRCAPVRHGIARATLQVEPDTSQGCQEHER